MPGKTCSACDGRGYHIFEVRIPCNYCGATGYKMGKKCLACKGDKYLKDHKSVDCTICDGTGKINY